MADGFVFLLGLASSFPFVEITSYKRNKRLCLKRPLPQFTGKLLTMKSWGNSTPKEMTGGGESQSPGFGFRTSASRQVEGAATAGERWSAPTGGDTINGRPCRSKAIRIRSLNHIGGAIRHRIQTENLHGQAERRQETKVVKNKRNKGYLLNDGYLI